MRWIPFVVSSSPVRFLDDPHLAERASRSSSVSLVEKPVLLAELPQPFERLLHVAAGLGDQLAEQRDHLLEPLLVGGRIGRQRE